MKRPRTLRKGPAEAFEKITRDFDISTRDMRRIAKEFRAEMRAGLAGKKSSLKMLPAYIGAPTGDERGRCVALDLGGTNFRIALVDLKGGGRLGSKKTRAYAIPKKHVTGSGTSFFDYIARCLKCFMEEEGISQEDIRLGFTFSFPLQQTGIASGVLVKWTKAFRVSGVEGRDVVKMLQGALARQRMGVIKVSAIINDTIGAFAALRYRDARCDVGVIIGTGTNGCYFAQDAHGGRLINIEWGNYDKLPTTIYDKAVDRASNNRGEQTLEKMVSGMYLGQIVEMMVNDLVNNSLLFITPNNKRSYVRRFTSELISYIEEDTTKQLRNVGRVLDDLGVSNHSAKDRVILKYVCRTVSRRSARILVSVLSGVITTIDENLSRDHAVAIDGSLYEKHPAFSDNIRKGLKELFGSKASRIKIILTKDGSSEGAAVVAAITPS